MRLYQELDKSDLISRLMPLLKSGYLYLNKDTGKLTSDDRLAYETPWVYTNTHTVGMDCRVWRQYLFDKMKGDMGCPPSGCQTCWKVVVRPKNLTMLMELKDYQKETQLVSKCGIEVREYTPALYGGYFYNRSYQEGLDKLDRVRKDLPEYNAILKRGCTEMEMSFPNSSSWEVTEQSLHWENLVSKWLDSEISSGCQNEIMEAYIVKKWIKYACTNNDDTYLNYTGGELIYPPPVTYERVKENNDGTISTKQDDQQVS